MVFVSAVEKLVPDKTKPVVVYGAGEGSLDAQVAAGKLSAAGFTQVNALEGGLPAWEAAGLPVEGEGALPAPQSFDGSYKVDAEASVIRWTGRNLFNHHNGTLKLSAGSIEVANNRLLNAKFEIDLQTMACEDLTDSQWNAMLIKHLRDADFFDVDHYPTGSFVGTSVDAILGSSEGSANYTIKGMLTLRGISKEIEFPALIAMADNGRITTQALLELDRTDFGSHYGSGKFFRFLGKHLVNDLIQLHLKIHADPAS